MFSPLQPNPLNSCLGDICPPRSSLFSVKVFWAWLTVAKPTKAINVKRNFFMFSFFSSVLKYIIILDGAKVVKNGRKKNGIQTYLCKNYDKASLKFFTESKPQTIL
jgi:hypothetical protein